jgi:hypothetical protein
MAKKTDELPKVSTSNTKKEILEAYNRLQEQLEAEAARGLQPEKAKEARRNKEVIAVADDLAAAKVDKAVDTLKGEINDVLSDITARMEGQTRKYLQLKEAISAKEKELEEIFEIEKSTYTLAALLESQKQMRTEFEEQMARREAEIDEEITRTKAQWEREQAEYIAKTQEQKEQDKKLQQREKEEYEYSLSREREEKTNELQDEIRQLQKELAEKRELFEKETKAKETELKAREEEVVEDEKRMISLQVQVDNIPKEKDDAVKKATKELAEKLTDEAEKNEKLMQKIFEGEKNVFITRIESFEHLATDQKKQIEKLSAQLEKAYGKVQDIAVKAVSGPREKNYSEPASRANEQRAEK